jgi:hypothetical protein
VTCVSMCLDCDLLDHDHKGLGTDSERLLAKHMVPSDVLRLLGDFLES